MKNIIRNTWVQVILSGLVIGAIFILLDNKFDFFNSKKEESLYNGPVQIDKEKTYFTTAEYSEFEYNFGKVKEGDTVKQNDPLLILEAMKMENIIKSAGEGIVRSVKVKKGDSVEKNQVLIEF